MTHATRFVAAGAVLTALVLLNVSCETQTPEIDALRARSEAGDAEAQHTLGIRYFNDADSAEAVRWLRVATEQGHADAQSKLV